VHDFLAAVATTVGRTTASFWFTYYVGHTMTWPSGDIALILGSASQYLRSSTRSPGNRSSRRQQDRDLARLANAIDANLETLPKGSAPPRTVLATEEGAIPFALIVVAVFAWMSSNECALNLHYLRQGPKHLLYAGPGGGVGDSLSRLGTLQEHVADTQPYSTLKKSSPACGQARDLRQQSTESDNIGVKSAPWPRAHHFIGHPGSMKTGQAWPTWSEGLPTSMGRRNLADGFDQWSDSTQFKQLAGTVIIPEADQSN